MQQQADTSTTHVSVACLTLHATRCTHVWKWFACVHLVACIVRLHYRYICGVCVCLSVCSQFSEKWLVYNMSSLLCISLSFQCNVQCGMARWTGEMAAVEAKAVRKIRGEEKPHPTSIQSIREPPEVQCTPSLLLNIFMRCHLLAAVACIAYAYLYPYSVQWYAFESSTMCVGSQRPQFGAATYIVSLHCPHVPNQPIKQPGSIYVPCNHCLVDFLLVM